MSDIHVEVPAAPVAPAARLVRLGRFARPATTLDTLLLLLALLAFMFGVGPTVGNDVVSYYSSSVLLVGGVLLLWIVCEWAGVVPLSGHGWIASPGWLRTFTQADVLLLLLVLLNSSLLHLALLAALVIWTGIAGISSLRGRRISADAWFHRAATFASFMAIMVANEASKIWLYSGALGVPPSPLNHWGFHFVLDGSIEVSCVLLLFLLAWTGVRAGQGRAIALLLVASLPAAALAGWAAAVSILNQQDYGYEHTYAWLLTLCWVLTLVSAVRGHHAHVCGRPSQ